MIIKEINEEEKERFIKLLDKHLANKADVRSKDRIEPFLEILKEYWLAKPYLRFGQIIQEIKYDLGKHDLFYVEEDEIQKALIRLKGE